MVDTIGFANAVSGTPAYSGRMLRQLDAIDLRGATAARPLGSLSGVRLGTPASTVSATSTTWTCQPFAGVADVMVAAESGPYRFAFDAVATGAMTAADGSNPRVDLLYVLITDPEDGATTPTAARVYLAGTAGASPSAPATPAGGIAIAQINVPKSGGGSPTVTWVAPYSVAAGGILPVPAGQYPTSPVLGEYVDDASLGLLRWNGTAWDQLPAAAIANVATFGTGVAATAGTNYQPRVRMQGKQVFLYGMITVSSGVSYTNLLTVPSGFQPPSSTIRPVGTTVTSAGISASLFMTAGVLQIPTGYASASIANGSNIPLDCMWWMD